jgi:methionyl-tRNA synthetase
LDLRIGEIKEAGPIKGSKKLIKLQVDIGGEIRQVVAGIAGAYSAEELVGTQVVVLTNLKPTKLFGVESQAMLLAADAAGKAVLLQPREFVETGTKVR